MHIKIDQSIKVEDPGDSVWAFSNHKEFAISIPAKVKRRAREIIRLGLKSQSRKIAKFKFFALGVFLLIEEFLPEIQSIVIDREYAGQESERVIKEFILRFIRKVRPDFPKAEIKFGKVPTGSKPDRLAYAVHKKRRQPDKTVALEEVLRVLALK